MDLNGFNRYQSIKKRARKEIKKEPTPLTPLQSKGGGVILLPPLYLN